MSQQQQESPAASGSAEQKSEFDKLREKIWNGENLYEDNDFPATADSIYPSAPRAADWHWKRPREIVAKPVFVAEGTSRLDLCQGDLGDCWFVAAVSSLAMKKTLFAKVVPMDQTFNLDWYAGMFHFFFWRFGEWEEVIIDDRLPVDDKNQLRFGHNRENHNEFWPALLEKAYAKLHGSYEAISGGHIRDAMVDFTGGISETYNLKIEEDIPADIFEIMKASWNMNSLMAAYIWGEVGDTKEEKLWNGLYRGHAYNITKVMLARVAGHHVPLVRLRNPWGEGEWTGAWSDTSDEWKALEEMDRRLIGIVIKEEGEFWMSFKDFLSSFHLLDIVHLGPEAFARLPEEEQREIEQRQQGRWHEAVHHGRWVRGINAGGSGLLSADAKSYFTNPQYHFTLRGPDRDDVGGDCTCVISLMQKDYRARKLDPAQKRIIIGFDVHKLKDRDPKVLDGTSDKALLQRQFKTRTPFREVSCRLQLPEGLFLVIPHTLRPNMDAEFLLRIYTYGPSKSGGLTDEETGPTVNKEHPSEVNIPEDVFHVYAEESSVVDARDLRDMLNALFRKEFREKTTFGIDVCRSLISMHDPDITGTLDIHQANRLWRSLTLWRSMFNEYDKDKSGYIDTVELRKVFRRLGFTLSLDVLSMIVTRYGGKERALSFEDFVLCVSKALTMYHIFQRKSSLKTGEVKMNLEQWMATTLYY